MKEVMAIIRMNKMNQTKRALADAGVASFTARKVVGRGKGKVDYLLLKGAQAGCEEAIVQLGPGPKLIPKRLLNIVVPDDLVPSVVRTIIEVNQTGHPGDGKIFVLPMLDAVRVRTGETSDAALDETLV
jgi:nitrogen regulatory protein PII 2